VLGWSPKVELAVGLQRTIAYFDQQLRLGHLHQATARPKAVPVSRARPALVEAVL
jgi:hypothetical protein